MASPIDPGHYPDSLILALVHGQPFEGAVAARAHVDTCPACRQRLRALSVEDTMIGDILASLDHPMPAASALTLPPRRRRRAGLAAAAAVVLGTAALAALPASPLHRLLFAPEGAAPVTPPTTPGGSTDPALASGIAVPSSDAVEIRFVRDQDEGVIEVRRVAEPDVALRSRGGTTAYDVTEGALVVDNLVPASTYLVDLPRTVRELRITVGERTALRWPADSARGATIDSTGTIRVPLTATSESP